MSTVVVALAACTVWGQSGPTLHADDFKGPLTQWVAEYKASPVSRIAAENGKLVIDTDAGATVWFGTPLAGDYQVSFTRTVPISGSKNDRLSDFNMFWMARDPANPASLFTRDGTFEQYDGLRLYYAGIGGNTNTTTRFRRYGGNGQRELLAEYTDPAHLLAANHTYAVQIAVYRGCTRVVVDGETVFSYRDPAPLTEGYFGFRTTWSRQEIGAFRVQRLQ
jgi:hypothetical protein